MGDNEKAAQFNAVNTRRLKFVVYLVAGLISSLAGVVLTIRVGFGQSGRRRCSAAERDRGRRHRRNQSRRRIRGCRAARSSAPILIALVGIGLDRAGFEFWDQAVLWG